MKHYLCALRPFYCFRVDSAQNMNVKSSCMFGPPQRTQPPSLNPSLSGSSSNSITSNVLTATSSGGSSVTNNMNSQRPPNSHKPLPLSDQRPRSHHIQPYKKEHSHYYPSQPPTVEVPKPVTVAPPAPAPAPPPPQVTVERSIFSPEVPLTPEPKLEPVTRIKEKKVEEPPPLAIIPVNKEEKIELKQEPVVEAKPPDPLPPPQPVEEPHKEVKKKKKKHKEHKDHKEHKKHKEHKEKHKEKHEHKKDKHKEPGPIVITIPKDKLTLPKEQPLKIKIPKDKIAPLPVASPVKLKISKEKLKESRKRERSESPDVVSTSKRPNGAVQVNIHLDFEHNGLIDNILEPVSPLANSDHVEDACRTVGDSPPPAPSPSYMVISPPPLTPSPPRVVISPPPPALSPPPPPPSPPPPALSPPPPPPSFQTQHPHPPSSHRSSHYNSSKPVNRYNNSYHYYNNNHVPSVKYREGPPGGGRHYSRPYRGKGRPPRYSRGSGSYPSHYLRHPVQAQPAPLQYQAPISHFQYFYHANPMAPTFAAPPSLPPLPDEPPPEVPPPPPPE